MPEVATGFPRVSSDGKTYTFTIRKGLKFSDGSALTAAAFKRALERAADPEAGFAGDRVHARRRRRRRAQRGQGRLGHRRHGQGPDADDQARPRQPDFLAELSMPFFAAVKPSMAIDPKGVNVVPVGRSVPDRQPQHRPVADARAEPVLQGQPPGERRQDPLHGQHGPEPEPAPGQGRPGRLRRRRRAADGTRRPRAAVRRQEGRPGQVLRQLVPGHELRRAEQLSGSVQPAQRPQGRELRHRPARPGARLGQFSGKRTDQILPPGLAGFREATLYPIKGADAGAGEAVGGRGGQHDHAPPHHQRAQDGPGAGGQVQPRADGPEGPDEAAAVRGRSPDRQHEGRGLRRVCRWLGGRLPGSVRLHQRPPGRRQHPGVEQLELRVLQQREIQQADERLAKLSGDPATRATGSSTSTSCAARLPGRRSRTRTHASSSRHA